MKYEKASAEIILFPIGTFMNSSVNSPESCLPFGTINTPDGNGPYYCWNFEIGEINFNYPVANTYQSLCHVISNYLYGRCDPIFCTQVS